MPRAGQRVITFSLADAHADFGLVTPPTDSAPWLARRGAALLPLAALKIPGRHNAANALATLALGDALRLPLAPMLDELREFTGLPHRAQWVAEIHGVRYINDSKGTNVGATLAAVGGLAGPLVVIAGGDGKGQDFAPLARRFPRQGPRRGAARPRRRAHRDRARRRLPHGRASRRWKKRCARPRASHNPATPCCCRPRVRASTCFAITRSAATCSPPRPWSWHDARPRSVHRSDRAGAGRGHRLVRPGHGHLGIDLHRQQGDGRSVPAISSGNWCCAWSASFLAAIVFCIRTEYLEKMAWPLLIAAVALLFFVLIPGLGHVVNGSRRWIRVLGFQFPGVRAGARAHAHFHRELRGASRRRTAQQRHGTAQADRPADVRRAAAAGGAGLRRSFGAVHHRLRNPVHRRCAPAFRVDRRGGRRRRHGAARDARAVPHGARHVVPRSVGGSVQQRVPAHAVADRHRARRVVRRRAGRERAEAVLSTRGAHRLPVRGAGRGARPGGRRGDARVVHRARVALLLDRAARIARGLALPGVSRRRLRPVAGRAGAHQHRREHGCSADQGPDAAAHELRTLEHDRHAGVGRPAAARVPRSDAEHARHGEPSSCRRGARRREERPLRGAGMPA